MPCVTASACVGISSPYANALHNSSPPLLSSPNAWTSATSSPCARHSTPPYGISPKTALNSIHQYQKESSNPQQHSLSRSLSIRHNRQGEESTRTRGRWRRRVEHVARALRKRDTEVADVEAEQGVALQCEALWCNHQTADSGATKAAADGARGGLQHSPSEGMIAAKPNLHTKAYPEILYTTQNTFTQTTTSKPSHSTKQLRTTLTIASGHRGTPQQHRERPGRRKTARRGRERKGNLELEKGASQKDETEMREKREREETRSTH